jgi:hypothetical protein
MKRHYPTGESEKKPFRNVLDPQNISLRQQERKFGCTTAVLTTYMIPFRTTARNPE